MIRLVNILFCILLCFIPSYGQNQSIFIHCEDTVEVKLSEIAKNVRLVKLPNDIIKNTTIQYFYPSDEYIYIQGLKNVMIINYEGRLIKNISYPDFITGITGDPMKKNIYVATEKNIYQYDSNGKEKKIHLGLNKNRIEDIFFHNNRVWIYSYKDILKDKAKKAVYQFSYFDVESSQIILFPFEYSEPLTEVHFFPSCVFSCYHNTLCFAFGLFAPSSMLKEYPIWKVTNMKAEVMLDWSANQDVLSAGSGYIGKYRFIQYILNRKWYVYLTDFTTNLSTCSRGIIDDIYHTGTGTISAPIDHNTYYSIIDNNLLIIKVKE